MIILGSDHGGFALKREIIAHLEERALPYRDLGAYGEDSCDYPVYGEAVARAVRAGDGACGILVCGTGIGISIAANKLRGIRCALCCDCFSAEMSRRHNDANILALGGRITGPGLALKIVDTFLDTPFDGGRHDRRVGLITEIENSEGSAPRT